MDTTDYVTLRRCVNCNSNNSESATVCYSCDLIFLDKMGFDDWSKRNKDLADIKLKSMQKEKRIGPPTETVQDPRDYV